MARRLAVFLAVVLCSLVAAVVGLLRIPPWHSRSLQRIHHQLYEITGLELHYLNHYTGTVRVWNREGELEREFELVAGENEGSWIEYDAQGAIARECTYRDGMLWDGYGQWNPRKAFMAEFKQGHPWNGYLPHRDPVTRKSLWLCFVDGRVVNEDEYRAWHGYPTDRELAPGLGCWSFQRPPPEPRASQ